MLSGAVFFQLRELEAGAVKEVATGGGEVGHAAACWAWYWVWALLMVRVILMRVRVEVMKRAQAISIKDITKNLFIIRI